MSRAEEMRELFARWKRSGESLMAFGKREGVSYSKLLYWRRKFEGSARDGKPELVRVNVVADSVPSTVPREKFEVWLANGVALEVSCGFDEGELRRLVGVLQSC